MCIAACIFFHAWKLRQQTDVRACHFNDLAKMKKRWSRSFIACRLFATAQTQILLLIFN